MRAEEEGRKKKAKRTHVPFSELGFKAKIYSGIETEYTRRRVKYKAARYGAENSRECFMGRLTFTLDANSLSREDIDALPAFNGIRKQEWEKVRHVTYHAREQVTCAICLERQFTAPQMTHCGHVFCWHCIYMHHFKSLKANNCPVCNQIYAIDAIVSCRPVAGKNFPQADINRIKLALKCHQEGDRKVYSCQDWKEDLPFARVVKATTQKILSLFTEEKAELQQFFHSCDSEQIRGWLQKVISLSYDKIEKAGHSHSKREYRLQRNQKKIDGQIFSNLEDHSNVINFYQEHTGRLIFLHPLCDKFLRACKKQLPLLIEEEIMGWEEVEYNMDMIRRYRQLHHMIINQEIDLVTIDLRPFLTEEQHRQYESQLQQCKAKKLEEQQREERESERLQVKYEQQKEYLKKLKKMEESEFYDIRVPTTINPSELGDNTYFPSLIQTKSLPDPTTLSTYDPPPPPKEKKPKPVLINEGDFPGLALTPKVQSPTESQQPPKLFLTKSQQPKLSSSKVQQSQFPHLALGSGKKAEQAGGTFVKKNSRKKKEKFVNVTDQFFQRREEDD